MDEKPTKEQLLEYVLLSSYEIITLGGALSSFLLTQPPSKERMEISQKYFDMVERLVTKLKEIGLVNS